MMRIEASVREILYFFTRSRDQHTDQIIIIRVVHHKVCASLVLSRLLVYTSFASLAGSRA